jgi:hypothetical protein
MPSDERQSYTLIYKTLVAVGCSVRRGVENSEWGHRTCYRSDVSKGWERGGDRALLKWEVVVNS